MCSLKIISFFLFLVVISISSSLTAQEPNIVGRWKLIAIQDAELFLDLEKDSAHFLVPLKNAEDSAMALELLSMTAVALGEMEMIFAKAGGYEERYNGKLDAKGSYVVDDAAKLLTLNIKRNGKNVVQRMEFVFLNQRLQLTDLDKDENFLLMMLERVR